MRLAFLALAAVVAVGLWIPRPDAAELIGCLESAPLSVCGAEVGR